MKTVANSVIHRLKIVSKCVHQTLSEHPNGDVFCILGCSLMFKYKTNQSRFVFVAQRVVALKHALSRCECGSVFNLAVGICPFRRARSSHPMCIYQCVEFSCRCLRYNRQVYSVNVYCVEYISGGHTLNQKSNQCVPFWTFHKRHFIC